MHKCNPYFQQSQQFVQDLNNKTETTCSFSYYIDEIFPLCLIYLLDFLALHEKCTYLKGLHGAANAYDSIIMQFSSLSLDPNSLAVIEGAILLDVNTNSLLWLGIKAEVRVGEGGEQPLISQLDWIEN